MLEARAIYDWLIKTTQQVDEVYFAHFGRAMTLTLEADRIEKDPARQGVARRGRENPGAGRRRSQAQKSPSSRVDAQAEHVGTETVANEPLSVV